jgi:RNA polymerase primary sigma factor
MPATLSPARPSASRRPRASVARSFGSAGSVAHDFRDIDAFAPLSTGEEAALFDRIRSGDEDARHALVRANLRFVVAVARRYQDRGVPLADLISEGNLGLLRRAARYDGRKGVKFISYAVWWIRQAILQLLAEQGRPVRIPPNVAGTMHRIGRRATALRAALGREPTHAELAAAAAVTEAEVVTATVVSARHLSLDAPTGGADAPLRARLADASAPTPDARAMDAALAEAVGASLSALSEREAQVVRLYFGLHGNDPKTLEEIGALIGVTRERVRQIKAAALARLRRGRSGATLAAFH